MQSIPARQNNHFEDSEKTTFLSSLRIPLKNLVNLVYLLIIVVFAACSDDDYSADRKIGIIMFTASHDCLIVLLDSVQNPVSSGYYELEKQPFVVYPKSEGVFFVHAYNYIPNDKPFIASLKFIKGYNLEYYIEF